MTNVSTKFLERRNEQLQKEKRQKLAIDKARNRKQVDLKGYDPITSLIKEIKKLEREAKKAIKGTLPKSDMIFWQGKLTTLQQVLEKAQEAGEHNRE